MSDGDPFVRGANVMKAINLIGSEISKHRTTKEKYSQQIRDKRNPNKQKHK